MKFDAQLGEFDLSKVSGEAQRMERLGFDALWSFETNHNPFIPLAMAATATSEIKVGTNIALAFARSPMITATVAWDIQRASRGRFMLGLGTQVRVHNERRLSAPWDAPAKRVRELILCIRAIWDNFQNGTRPDFQGEFYQFRLMTPFFTPGPIDHPDIPIYLAGVKPLMCRIGGEVADGFAVHPFHSVSYLKEVVRPNLDAGAKIRGSAVDKMELFAPVFVVTGETEQERSELEQTVRQQIAFYASTPNYRDVLELHGWVEVGEELSKMVRNGEWDQLGSRISDEMLDTFATHGTPDRLPGLLHDRYEGVLDRISLYFPVPAEEPDARWQSFLKAFRQANQ